jgi:fructose-specific phosphotransferase system IIC component
VRVPLVYLLPINVMVGVSTALLVVTIGGLIAWNARYAIQAQRRTQKR